MKTIISLFITLLLFNTSPAPAQENRFENQLREFIKQVIRENPELVYETVNRHIQKQKEAQQKQQIENALKNPVEDTVTADNPAKGEENAVITIIEYSDFQCPHCANASQMLERLMQKYPGKIRRVFKNNPLEDHPFSLQAAAAALAAHRQGKFWLYHDLLFFNGPDLTEDMFTKIAKDLSLDMELFEKDRKSEEIAKQIAGEKTKINALGITGTPSFILNGVLINGAQPQPLFEQIIEKILSQ